MKELIERLKNQRDRDAAEHCPAEIIALQDETIAAIEAQEAENKRLQQETINRSCNEAKLRAERDALAAKLVPLTQKQRMAVWNSVKTEGDGKWEFSFSDVVNAVEAAHGIQAKGGQHEDA